MSEHFYTEMSTVGPLTVETPFEGSFSDSEESHALGSPIRQSFCSTFTLPFQPLRASCFIVRLVWFLSARRSFCRLGNLRSTRKRRRIFLGSRCQRWYSSALQNRSENREWRARLTVPRKATTKMPWTALLKTKWLVFQQFELHH